MRLVSLPGSSKEPAMIGTSGFHEVRSSTPRSSTNRLLHEQQPQFGTGSWNRFRTHNLIAPSTGISTKRETVPDTVSIARPCVCMVWLVSLTELSKEPAMNGASGFHEVRSSTPRLPSNRLLHEQRTQFGISSWHILLAHDLISHATVFSTTLKTVPDTISRSQIGCCVSKSLNSEQVPGNISQQRRHSEGGSN